MSIAGSCIGIEIASETVRAVILNNTAEKIIGYAEVKRSHRPENPFGRLSVEIASLWGKLPEKFTGNVRVSAAFGAAETGVRSAFDTDKWLDELEQVDEISYNKVSLGDAIAYARSDVLASYQRIFTENDIPLERLELSPQAAARVIDSPGPVSGSIVSGVGWQFYISDGELVRAEAVDQLECKTLKVKTATPDSTLDLAYLQTLNVSQGLLDTFDIERLDLAVSVGTAKGLVTSEPHFRAATPNHLFKTLDECAETRKHDFVIDLTDPVKVESYEQYSSETKQLAGSYSASQSAADAFSMTTPSILSDGWNSNPLPAMGAPAHPGEYYAIASTYNQQSQVGSGYPIQSQRHNIMSRVLIAVGLTTVIALAAIGLFFLISQTGILESLSDNISGAAI